MDEFNRDFENTDNQSGNDEPQAETFEAQQDESTAEIIEPQSEAAAAEQQAPFEAESFREQYTAGAQEQYAATNDFTEKAEEYRPENNGQYPGNGYATGGQQQNATYYSAYSPYAQQGQYNGYSQQRPPVYGSAYPGTGSPQQGPNHKNKGRKKGVKIFSGLVAIVVVFAVAFGAGSLFGKKNSNSASSGNPSQVEQGKSENRDKTQMDIAETPNADASTAAIKGALTPVQIANKVQKSIVGIICYASNSDSIASEGTGIIMGTDTAGEYTYVVTCAHVIADATGGITVQLYDSKKYDAEMVGYDSKTDVGVVKVKVTGLTAAEFGDSTALKVGEPVYAVGNPGGTEFFGSFTGGMVSAIDRSVTSTYTMECIQHDAAINPGNSGGALVNVYGQVIGINSLKIVNTEYEGMGFAIPIKTAKSVVDNLIAYGYVPNRPKLGIKYIPATSSQYYNMVVQLKGLPAGSLIIGEIEDGSAFTGTQAQKYDLITAVNGKPMTTADVLLDTIENGKVGDTLKLTIYRISNNYKVTNFDVEVKLIEDKGSTEKKKVEEETTSINVFDFFQNPFSGF